MTDIESIISRSIALKEFDEELMPFVRGFEARQRQIDRTKRWTRYMTIKQKQELLYQIDQLRHEAGQFRMQAAYRWMTEFPGFSAPSFSPSAIRKRVSRRKPFDNFHIAQAQDIYLEVLKRILTQAQEELDELVE